MADKYVNQTGLMRLWAKIKAYVDGRTPAIQTQGNWKYRVNADGTFECWYTASKQSITITNTSGNLYRSELTALPLPSNLYGNRACTIRHAEINTAHNNYPCWGMLASISKTGINYYAMSGGSRNASPNYTVTAYIFGTLD